VQTPSDTTFRVYDWGRVGRELHVDQAMQCIDFGPAPATARLEKGQRNGRLVTTEFFTIDELRLRPGKEVPIGPGCTAVIVLRGEGTLAWGSTRETIKLGQSVLVPAALSPKFTAIQETTLLLAGLGA
jgi:mannose-6-phosphate isomerase